MTRISQREGALSGEVDHAGEPGGWRALCAVESARMSETLDAIAAPLYARGLTVSSVITAGDPKQVLLDEAEHWEADALFVGARGLSRVERFLLGSVSAAVAARAHCSVEVVRTA